MTVFVGTASALASRMASVVVRLRRSTWAGVEGGGGRVWALLRLLRSSVEYKAQSAFL